MRKYKWNVFRFIHSSGGSIFWKKCYLSSDVPCACDCLSEEMSVVATFMKVCHGFVYTKGESSMEQIWRSVRGKLKEVTRLACKRWHKECNRYQCL